MYYHEVEAVLKFLPVIKFNLNKIEWMNDNKYDDKYNII